MMIIIGKVNDTKILAGVGLGMMLVCIWAISLGLGLNTAIETLSAQAFGAGNLEFCGKLLNRMYFIMILFFIPIFGLLLVSADVLYRIDAEKEVIEIANRFMIQITPGIFFFLLFDTTRLFLVSMDEPNVPTFITILAVPFLCWLGHLLTLEFGYGATGLAISFNVTYFCMLVALVFYCVTTPNEKVRKAWSLPNWDSFREWGVILNIGVPGVAMYLIDWLCMYCAGFLSTLLDVNQVAAMSIVLLIQPVVTCFAQGMHIASTVYVGSAIGDTKIFSAKRLAKASIVMSLVTSLCIGAILIYFRHSAGSLFS